VLSFARNRRQAHDYSSSASNFESDCTPDSKSIEFSTALAPELWSSGDATPHQVLMNLCVNARDAMPDGTLSVSAENIIIDEHYARMNLNCRCVHLITVTDTGTGISTEILIKFLAIFYNQRAR